MLKVFVYGTLKPGEINYQRYCLGKTVSEQPAIAYGQLYALPVGYPAMTSGENHVCGFLLTFSDDRVLTALDRLEDYDPDRSSGENEYTRLWSHIFGLNGEKLGKAWVYQMSLAQVRDRGGVLLPDGCWHQLTGKDNKISDLFSE
ncbi:gamma-glutamylcyclotransferase family protein [Merismopedia glauca]|uniref:Gamma-glutamylcyclotransferase AIG2-like domain-containing protein n=1 Tax=Merismopedia glauca CCAP 1448/3 TaxID=1296344 RepID=A0A2T1BYP1_9CYAN|nr:gamma-glutamylcyclotransferase [Merismopedia glauca]PSB01008.1 hypothetical protein C7B64_20545 [Merismopedia glauca CCAP 1448/3]